MQPILTNAQFVATSQAVSCEISGETVILDMASGQYFALDPIGTQVWTWLSTPASVGSLCQRLLQEYDVPAQRCEADVAALLEQMLGNGLVKVHECEPS